MTAVPAVPRGQRDPDEHTVRWRTAAGRRYTSRPHDWLEAVRDEPSHEQPPQQYPPGDDPPPF